jgi:hypothetical protein
MVYPKLVKEISALSCHESAGFVDHPDPVSAWYPEQAVEGAREIIPHEVAEELGSLATQSEVEFHQAA